MTQLLARKQVKGTDCSNEDEELMYWLGSKFKDGSWSDYQTGEKLILENVKDPKTEQEGCLMNYFGELQARECKRKYCSFCKLREKTSPILVKGICSLETEENKNFDTIFYLSGIRNSRIYFRGSGFSHLYYKPGEGDTSDSRTGNWIIQSLRDPTLEIILPKKYSKLYPFGRYIWEVGSKEVCDLVPGTPLPLTFTSCPEESFTCSSGECIPLANKCNSKIDCTDESDESQCNYLQVPDIYSGHLGPRSKGNQPVPVYINISILAYPDIDTMGLKFTSDYYINLRWYDGRLSFKDLNDNSILNNVQLEALITMWSPQLAFLNALGPFQTVVDDLSVCTIVLEKAPTFDDKTDSWECKYIYTTVKLVFLFETIVSIFISCFFSMFGHFSTSPYGL
ncbi:uncharacterized protein LOC111716869 [Eurytemora carolleeae]|uniref:uncharacterized protein LOC111716869 n=1 Tax=Eurytemora carolleeae TaxID=1294199 RepID=UPI000C75F8F6|nr:uncharacterized protein LOC111716869 [Eurytemora carolleeae]|eukprot:XP_023348145.1 uncharacterized protein LOC111716869 [Eurytemora affinis]